MTPDVRTVGMAMMSDSRPYAAGPLDRLLRDVHTAQQHMMFSPKVYEATGRLLLGLELGLPGY